MKHGKKENGSEYHRFPFFIEYYQIMTFDIKWAVLYDCKLILKI